MPDPYTTYVWKKSSEEILSQYSTADSNLAPYLQVSAQIRSNQELIAALKQASVDSGKAAVRIVVLTVALVGAALLQAVATGWDHLVWWVNHGFTFGQ